MFLENFLSTILGGFLVVIGNYFNEYFKYKKELKKLKRTKLEKLFKLLTEFAKSIKLISSGQIKDLEKDFTEINLIVRFYFPNLKEYLQNILREFDKENYNKVLYLLKNFYDLIEKEAQKIS